MAEDFVRRLSISTPNVNQETLFLSGGNQQKVVIAKWLCSQAKVLILDEPTRGIDVGAKVEVYQLINALAKNGATVLMISSELPEVLGVSDRILVMRNGRLMGELTRAEATEEEIMTYASGRALRYVSSGFQGRKASIGFLGNPAAPAYREAILAGLEATVRPFGGEVRTPLTTSPASLRELAEPLLASGVQALVVQAPDPSDLASVLPRAASAGVPVVAVDSELVAGPVTTISSDSRLGVDLLTSCLQERVPKGRVLVWTTPASSEIATRRSRNASELLTRQARFEVVSAPCDLGQELENPQLKAILAPAELEEHEALAAVEAAGRTGEIQVLGFGGSVRSLRAVA